MIRRFIVTILALGMGAELAISAAPGVVSAEEGTLSRIQGSIDIAAGEHAGNLSTVNGSINIGSEAVVGHAHAVNGSLHLQPHATADSLTTVNGSIEVADGGHVTGDVSTVNGALHVLTGADVTGSVHNVNGGIHVEQAHVIGSVSTTNGNLEIGPNAHIDGDVLMRDDHSEHSYTHGEPHVVIGPGTVVKGKLRFERKVVLYVSDHATVGPIEGAEPLTFSGDHPPG